MAFGASQTYIYAYIVFASVYLIASFTFVANALRVSTGLSRARQATPASEAQVSAQAVGQVVAHSQRLVDYTQLSTLLPLVYIVGSVFLGSVIVRNSGVVRGVNVGWIAFTTVCTLASVALTVMGVRESSAIGSMSELPHELSGKANEAFQRIGLRLGVSAALLLLVAVFTMLNLWSILGSLDSLRGVDFLL